MLDFIRQCCLNLHGISTMQLPASSCIQRIFIFHQWILCSNCSLFPLLMSLLYMHLLAGFQFLDAFLCCTGLCREHSQIWVATTVSGIRTYFSALIRCPHNKYQHNSAGMLQAVVLAPSVKSEKKVRGILEELCGNVNR